MIIVLAVMQESVINWQRYRNLWLKRDVGLPNKIG